MIQGNAIGLRFKKGEMVRVINPENRLFDQIAEVIKYDQLTNKYLLQFQDEYRYQMFHYDLAKHLDEREDQELQRAQLFQMADLAIEWEDKHWFEWIGKQLNELNEAK